jgi:uncharacterized membrane protein
MKEVSSLFLLTFFAIYLWFTIRASRISKREKEDEQKRKQGIKPS